MDIMGKKANITSIFFQNLSKSVFLPYDNMFTCSRKIWELNLKFSPYRIFKGAYIRNFTLINLGSVDLNQIPVKGNFALLQI